MSYRPSSSRRAVPARAGSARARAVASSRAIEVDGISVTVTRKRIRNMYLRVKPPTGAVEVSAPMRMAERRIREFVVGRREWIVAQRERIAQARRLVVEEMAARAAGEAVAVPLEGLDDVGMPSSSSSPSPGASDGPGASSAGPDRPDKSGAGGPDGPNGSDAQTSGPDGSPAGALCDHAIVWTDERRRLAAAAIEATLPDLLAKWGPIVGRSPAHITLRLMTSRWGSCTPKTKRIRLNLQLGLMEPRFLEYVLVHEMTHLWEHGHGPGFRARMDAYLPGWRDLRRELNRRAVL